MDGKIAYLLGSRKKGSKDKSVMATYISVNPFLLILINLESEMTILSWMYLREKSDSKNKFLKKCSQ